MARNRLIYCLSEAAVVVTSCESGGTHTGAVENLRVGWVPLFVVANGVAAGNRDLLTRGALPIEACKLVETDTVLDDLIAREGTSTNGQGAGVREHP